MAIQNDMISKTIMNGDSLFVMNTRRRVEEGDGGYRDRGRDRLTRLTSTVGESEGRDRQTHRQRKRGRDVQRQTHRQRKRGRDSPRQTDTQRKRGRDVQRQADTQTEEERKRCTETDRHTDRGREGEVYRDRQADRQREIYRDTKREHDDHTNKNPFCQEILVSTGLLLR